ncbi:MAG: NAD(P)/FAD-dependent oxidoreductase [Burkholderiales bacterium]
MAHDIPHVVILGCGFGGLAAVRALARAPVRVTIVDRTNHHLFQPLLYQVATAGLAAPAIAAPIRFVLRKQANVTSLLGEVTDIDVDRRVVTLDDAVALDFDYLVIATGVTHSYFGNDPWARHAPGLKTLDDAFAMRRKILLAFERAERESDPTRRREWLTFVVVGAGPTGVELAGTLAEIARHTLANEFRRIDSRDARIVLVEGADRVLTTYPRDLSDKAAAQLRALGVELRLGARVSKIDAFGVMLGDEPLVARTVLWAAGIQASPLGARLRTPLDRAGRVPVLPDLSVADHPNVFVIGDLATLTVDRQPVPGVAPAAKQMGRCAASNILARHWRKPTRPFRYRDYGSLATIGRHAAVGVIGKVKLSGFGAWLFWLFLHIFFLIGFRNRLVVLIDWAWAYATFQRYARVMTGISVPGVGTGESGGEKIDDQPHLRR